MSYPFLLRFTSGKYIWCVHDFYCHIHIKCDSTIRRRQFRYSNIRSANRTSHTFCVDNCMSFVCDVIQVISSKHHTIPNIYANPIGWPAWVTCLIFLNPYFNLNEGKVYASNCDLILECCIWIVWPKKEKKTKILHWQNDPMQTTHMHQCRSATQIIVFVSILSISKVVNIMFDVELEQIMALQRTFLGVDWFMSKKSRKVDYLGTV